MAGTATVKAHLVVAADRSDSSEIALQTGCSSRQRIERQHAAPVGCELGDLLAGDHTAHFARFGLNFHYIGFDGDAVTLRANLQRKINTWTVIDVQNRSE